MQLNSKPYKIFKELKSKFPVVTVRIAHTQLFGMHLAFKNHRDYIAHLFKEKGVVVNRWMHDYDSLNGNHPQLGVVYLAGDSVLEEVFEAHVLIGHHARYIAGDASYA